MTVDGVGPVDPVSNLKRGANRVDNPRKAAGADSIQVSAEAKNAAELYHAKELVKSSPDVRADRIAEVKRKLEDPNYLSEEVLDNVADRLMDSFGI